MRSVEINTVANSAFLTQPLKRSISMDPKPFFEKIFKVRKSLASTDLNSAVKELKR